VDLTDLAAARAAHERPSELRSIANNISQQLDASRADVIRDLTAIGGRIRASYWIANALAVDLPRFSVEILRADQRVSSVEPDYPMQPTIFDQLQVANILDAWNGGEQLPTLPPLARYAGRGVIIAIADSGFDLYNVPDHTVIQPGENPEYILPALSAAFDPNPIYYDTLGDWPASVWASSYPSMIPGTRILRAVDLYNETNCQPFSVNDPDHFPPPGYELTPEDINFDGGLNFFYGHGTAISHAAAGAGSVDTETCGEIMAGPAHRAGLLLYKIVDDSTQQSFAWGSSRLTALQEAVADGADVFNMSFGGIPAPTALEDRIFDAAGLLDMLIVVPAGNEGLAGCGAPSPANYEIEHAFFNGLYVGSTAADNTISAFSSQGPLRYIVASLIDPLHFMTCPPGNSSTYQDPIDDPSFQPPLCTLPGGCLITSSRDGVNLTAPGEFVRLVAQDLNSIGHPFADPSCSAYVIPSGSSISSPITAGVAAMVRGAAPDITGLAVRAILMNEADESQQQPSSLCGGQGRLNGAASVLAARERRFGTGSLAPSNPLFPGSQVNNFVEAWISAGISGVAETTATWDRLKLDTAVISDLALEIMDDGVGNSVNACSDQDEENWERRRYVVPGNGGFDKTYARIRVRISTGTSSCSGGSSGSNAMVLMPPFTEIPIALATNPGREPFRLAKPFEISTISPAKATAVGGVTLHLMGPLFEQASSLNSVVFKSPSMPNTPAPTFQFVTGASFAGTWIDATMPVVAPSSPVTVEANVNGVVSQWQVKVSPPSVDFDRAVYAPGDPTTLTLTWVPGGDAYLICYGLYQPNQTGWWPAVGAGTYLGQFHMVDTTFHSFLVGTATSPPPTQLTFGIPGEPLLIGTDIVVQTLSRVPNPAGGMLRLISAPTVAHFQDVP